MNELWYFNIHITLVFFFPVDSFTLHLHSCLLWVCLIGNVTNVNKQKWKSNFLGLKIRVMLYKLWHYNRYLYNELMENLNVRFINKNIARNSVFTLKYRVLRTNNMSSTTIICLGWHAQDTVIVIHWETHPRHYRSYV